MDTRLSEKIQEIEARNKAKDSLQQQLESSKQRQARLEGKLEEARDKKSGTKEELT